jgi:hypothetical protein
LSEAFQLASAGVCDTGLQTRSRHACESVVRVLTTGPGSAGSDSILMNEIHNLPCQRLGIYYALTMVWRARAGSAVVRHFVPALTMA